MREPHLNRSTIRGRTKRGYNTSKFTGLRFWGQYKLGEFGGPPERTIPSRASNEEGVTTSRKA
jgi:hypothetical protein